VILKFYIINDKTGLSVEVVTAFREALTTVHIQQVKMEVIQNCCISVKLNFFCIWTNFYWIFLPN